MSREKCLHCHQNLPVEFSHGLNLGLVSALAKLEERAEKEPFRLSELGLTRNQIDNFQKLKYWGLVVSCYEEDAVRRGWWRVTDNGVSFLRGKLQVPKIVKTLSGKRTGWAGDLVSAADVVAGYQYRGDWATQAAR